MPNDQSIAIGEPGHGFRECLGYGFRGELKFGPTDIAFHR